MEMLLLLMMMKVCNIWIALKYFGNLDFLPSKKNIKNCKKLVSVFQIFPAARVEYSKVGETLPITTTL